MHVLKNLIPAIMLVAFVSCSKQPVVTPPPVVEPAMTYTDLTGKSVSFGQSVAIDLDKNGKTDIVFNTLLTADDVNKLVKNRYLVETSLYCNLAVHNDLDIEDEECLPLKKGDPITIANLPGNTWYNIASINLMRKVTHVITNNIHWESKWINRGHLYLPIQLLSSGNVYAGWVELEADSKSEKLILYKAAISAEPGKTVKAGM